MSKRILNFEDFLWLPVLGFKAIGFDFLRTPKSYFIKGLLNVIFTFSFVSHIYCFFHIIHQFPALDFRNNMLGIMTTSGYIAFAINGNIKFFALLSNRKRVCKIYDFLKSIYPTTIAERNVYRVDQYYYTKKELSVTMTFIGSCWLLMLKPIVQSIVQFIYDANVYGYEESHFQYLKFYETEYIINHRNPWTYILNYLFECASSHYLILTNLGTDLWLIPFATQVRMHLDQISQNLHTLKPTLENSEKDQEQLAKIIKKHQRLMNLHFELKCTFKISMAFNIITTVGIICAVALRVILAGVTDLLFFSYLTSAVLQFYIICYHGQKLAEASENVAFAAYSNRWYNASLEYRRMLLTLMIRAARPTEIEIIASPPISLDTFKIVMTVSYRIFTIFNSMLE